MPPRRQHPDQEISVLIIGPLPPAIHTCRNPVGGAAVNFAEMVRQLDRRNFRLEEVDITRPRVNLPRWVSCYLNVMTAMSRHSPCVTASAGESGSLAQLGGGEGLVAWIRHMDDLSVLSATDCAAPVRWRLRRNVLGLLAANAMVGRYHLYAMRACVRPDVRDYSALSRSLKHSLVREHPRSDIAPHGTSTSRTQTVIHLAVENGEGSSGGPRGMSDTAARVPPDRIWTPHAGHQLCTLRRSPSSVVRRRSKSLRDSCRTNFS